MEGGEKKAGERGRLEGQIGCNLGKCFGPLDPSEKVACLPGGTEHIICCWLAFPQAVR